MTAPLAVSGFVLQESPQIAVASIPGPWLLSHTTPSWRIDDPEQGFQRIVRQDRAQAIAVAVLDQKRTFPNAIVLATDAVDLRFEDCELILPRSSKFLVVDGQHRLWAQKFSEFEASYACVIHTGLSEVQMARLFLEINDNQKRVPSSLRWDLVRLVRPEDDPEAIEAAELTKQLASDDSSPLYQRIDLTGEQNAIALKQGSVAPELKRLIGRRSSLHGASYDDVYDVIVRYLLAVKGFEPDTWGTPDSRFYKARVFRAMLRILEAIVDREEGLAVDRRRFQDYLERIDAESLSDDAIRAAQGNAGIAAITTVLKSQVF